MLRRMKKPVLVLQQLACEPAALLADTLHGTGWHTETVLVQEQPIPTELKAYAGLIVMGGPMSANDVHLDFIAAELALLKQAIAEDFPVIGICLGAQLLAKAAGADIYQADERELGWYSLYPMANAADDPLFSHLENEIGVFQWHGETFTLPAGASLLASCRNVPNQAFRLGSCQYGLQFHVEVDEAIIRDWVDICDSERAHLGPAGVQTMLAETPLRIGPAHAFCRAITTAWTSMLREKDA